MLALYVASLTWTSSRFESSNLVAGDWLVWTGETGLSTWEFSTSGFFTWRQLWSEIQKNINFDKIQTSLFSILYSWSIVPHYLHTLLTDVNIGETVKTPRCWCWFRHCTKISKWLIVIDCNKIIFWKCENILEIVPAEAGIVPSR